jgi:hypothetical protein
MTQEESPEARPEYFWIVCRDGHDEIEVWTSQEKAEASIAARTDAKPEELLLYHVAESEVKRAFPNRPITGGDVELDTSNKYIKKGWKPGMKK